MSSSGGGGGGGEGDGEWLNLGLEGEDSPAHSLPEGQMQMLGKTNAHQSPYSSCIITIIFIFMIIVHALMATACCK